MKVLFHKIKCSDLYIQRNKNSSLAKHLVLATFSMQNYSQIFMSSSVTVPVTSWTPSFSKQINTFKFLQGLRFYCTDLLYEKIKKILKGSVNSSVT